MAATNVKAFVDDISSAQNSTSPAVRYKLKIFIHCGNCGQCWSTQKYRNYQYANEYLFK